MMESQLQTINSEPQTEESIINYVEIATAQMTKGEKYKSILRQVLPVVGTDIDKVIQTEVMAALNVEGIIISRNEPEYLPMARVIAEAIKADPERREEAVLVAYRILRESQGARG